MGIGVDQGDFDVLDGEKTVLTQVQWFQCPHQNLC